MSDKVGLVITCTRANARTPPLVIISDLLIIIIDLFVRCFLPSEFLNKASDEHELGNVQEIIMTLRP